jgi:hypothetical protein
MAPFVPMPSALFSAHICGLPDWQFLQTPQDFVLVSLTTFCPRCWLRRSTSSCRTKLRCARQTADGTATNGINYFATNGILVFTNGETIKTFDVRLKDDGVIRGDTTVVLGLGDPLGGQPVR